MSEHVQVRIISLLEEAGNSFEQLETLANRVLRTIPAERVDTIDLRQIERDCLEEDDEVGSEADHLLFIRYRATTEGKELFGD
jgi:hypothetical protein